MAGESVLPETVIEQYKSNLVLIEGRMAQIIEPKRIPPDLVRSYLQTKMIIEKQTTDFSNEDKLTLLDQLEAWYVDKDLPFPNPIWLENQRKALRQAS